MAARKNKLTHAEETRLKIQTSQLINRLQAYALDKAGKVKMSDGQVRAAMGLLRKTIPDLQSVDLQGQVDSSITVKIVRFGDNAPE